jgi:uncharacterized membrane protein
MDQSPSGEGPSSPPSSPQLVALPVAGNESAQMLSAGRAQVPLYGPPPVGIQLTLPGIPPSIQQQTTWQGPYPPPEALERYEQLLPGAFNRMITMAEQLQASQIDEARRALSYTRADSRRGQWLGFFSTVGAMEGALICVYLASPWVAAAFLSVPVMAVGKALIESARSQTPTQIIKAAAESTAPSPPPTPPSS